MRVLVVDDSAFMRKVITDILNSDPELNVVGTARDGSDAITRTLELHPDVITMDIEMPRVDGLTALKKIMETRPTPVVMLSALTHHAAPLTLEALELGAIDYIPKPSGSLSLDIGEIREEIIKKVKTAALARIRRRKKHLKTPLRLSRTGDSIIAIASSTGGPAALAEILPQFPQNTPPIAIVQHMPTGFTSSLAERLDQESRVEVREAEEGDILETGVALIAPGGQHMEVDRLLRVKLNQKPKLHGVRPAADPLFTSLARHAGKRVIGVVLTGMGRDGADGVVEIKRQGGQTLAQDRDSCTVYGMPQEAVKTGNIDKVAPLGRLPTEILRMCTRRGVGQ